MEDEAPRFSLVRMEKTATLVKADGEEEKITIREVTGQERDSYMNLMMSKVRLGPDGKPAGLKNMAGLHSKLLEMSLFHEDAKAFSPKEVSKLPATAMMGLFEMAKEISGLNEGAEEEAGNDSEASD